MGRNDQDQEYNLIIWRSWGQQQSNQAFMIPWYKVEQIFFTKKIDASNICKSSEIVCEISDLKDFTRDERRSISSLELILFHFVKESATREAERENQPGCKTSFARIQEKVEALTHSDKNLSMVANNRYWINYFMKWLLKMLFPCQGISRWHLSLFVFVA